MVDDIYSCGSWEGNYSTTGTFPTNKLNLSLGNCVTIYSRLYSGPPGGICDELYHDTGDVEICYTEVCQ